MTAATPPRGSGTFAAQQPTSIREFAEQQLRLGGVRAARSTEQLCALAQTPPSGARALIGSSAVASRVSKCTTSVVQPTSRPACAAGMPDAAVIGGAAAQYASACPLRTRTWSRTRRGRCYTSVTLVVELYVVMRPPTGSRA